MSVAATMVVAVVMVTATLSVGYRSGRAHSAWRDYRTVRHEVPFKRRETWTEVRGLLISAALLIGILFAAGFTASR